MLHLIGGGGHASVVADIARRAGVPSVVLWCDESPDLARFPAGTSWRALDELDATQPVLLGVGDLAVRARMRERFPRPAPAVVDPSAVLGHAVRLGAGTVVMPACVINACAAIGEDAIINTGTIVEHDCVIGFNTHLSPGVRLAGGVRVGDNTHIGTGAVVLPGIAVGDRAVVGAGAVVTQDVEPGLTVVGVPARPLVRA